MLDYYNNPAVKRRDYSKIFTGSNQEGGYENIFLSFSAATKEIVFEPSKITFFHYSKFAPPITIHQADLIAEGAIAGTSPSRADKIYKKQAGYPKYESWGQSLDVEQGTWLCTWLSGSGDPNSPTIWVDRFYNPGYLSLQEALTSVEEIYHENERIMYDSISLMTFDPGVLYMYHHFGDEECEQIISSLNADKDNVYLRLKIDDWINDSSSFKNNGSINNVDAIVTEKIHDTNTIVLSLSNDPDVEYKVPFDRSYNPQDFFTVSSWVKAEDWDTVKGNQIFGNYFRGGWGLCYETGFVNPLMAVFENTNGHLLLGNQTGRFYTDKMITSPLSTDNNFVSLSGIAITPDMYVWVFTNGSSKTLYKLDYNGDILNTISFPTTANLTDISMDSSGAIYLLNQAASKVLKYDPNTGNLLSETEVPSSDNLLSFKSTDIMVTKPGLGMVLDKGDNIWQVTKPNDLVWRLLKNNSPLFAIDVDNFKSMQVDADNYVWILYNNRDWVKVKASTAEVSLSGSIGYNDLSGGRSIGFTKEFVNGEYIDYGWILQSVDQKLYKIDLAGRVLEEMDLGDKFNFNRYPVLTREQMSFAARGDWTGGNAWSNKYATLLHRGMESLYYNITFKTPTGDIITRKLKYDITKLTNNEWHLLTLTYNQNTGKVIIYNNSIIEASADVPVGSTIYSKYNNNLIFGGNSGKFTSLDEELLLNQLHFNGSLAEPVIYSRELTANDISHIFKSKYKAHKITWNVPIGKQVFIEEIERFFKHKLPGSKSNFFNINLMGLKITDDNIKASIEDIIRKTIKRVSPANTELYKIKWT